MPLSSIREFQAGLSKLEAEDYLWKHLLPPSPGFSVLAGPPGVGKTNLAFQILSCIALGRPVFGRPTKKARVGCYLFEGGDNLSDRFDKLLRYYDDPDLEKNFLIARESPRPINEMMKQMVKEIKDLELKLVFLDPFNKFNYGDLTRPQDMQRNAFFLEQLSNETGAHLLINHHVRKKGNDTRYNLSPGDIDNIKGASELVSGSLTAMVFVPESQDDLRRIMPPQRGAPTLRGPDYLTLHFSRAQASPEDIAPLSLKRDRENLQFVSSEGWVPVL